MAQFNISDFTLSRSGPKPLLVTEASDLCAAYAIAGIPNEFMVQGKALNVRYARAVAEDVYCGSGEDVVARVWRATRNPDVANLPAVHILND